MDPDAITASCALLTASQSGSLMFSLPGEIRQMIWRMVFSDPKPQLIIKFGKRSNGKLLTIPQHFSPNLLYTCKGINAEAATVFNKCFELHVSLLKEQQHLRLFNEMLPPHIYSRLRTIIVYCNKRYAPSLSDATFRFRNFPNLKTFIFRISFHLRICCLHEVDLQHPPTEHEVLERGNVSPTGLSPWQYKALTAMNKVAAWTSTPFVWPNPIIAAVAAHDSDGWLDDLLEPSTYDFCLADRCRRSSLRDSMIWPHSRSRKRQTFHADDQKVIDQTTILIETLCDPCNLCIENDFSGYLEALLVVVDAKRKTVVERRLLDSDEYYSRIKLNSHFIQ